MVAGWVLGQGWDANRWEAPPDRWALDAVRTDRYTSTLSTSTRPGSTAQRSEQRGSIGAPPIRLGGESSAMPMGILPGFCSSGPSSWRYPPFCGAAGRCAARGFARARPSTPVRRHRHPRRGAGPRAGGLSAARASRRTPPACAVSSAGGRARPTGGRRCEKRAGIRWLTIGGVKLFLDGGLGKQTAWMLEPYEGSQGSWHADLHPGAGAGSDPACGRGRDRGDGPCDRRCGRAAGARPPPGRTAGKPPSPDRALPVRPSADLGRAACARYSSSRCSRPIFLTDIPLVERHWGASRERRVAFRSVLALSRTDGRDSAAMCRSPHWILGKACTPRWCAGPTTARRQLRGGRTSALLRPPPTRRRAVVGPAHQHGVHAFPRIQRGDRHIAAERDRRASCQDAPESIGPSRAKPSNGARPAEYPSGDAPAALRPRYRAQRRGPGRQGGRTGSARSGVEGGSPAVRFGGGRAPAARPRRRGPGPSLRSITPARKLDRFPRLLQGGDRHATIPGTFVRLQHPCGLLAQAAPVEEELDSADREPLDPCPLFTPSATSRPSAATGG